MPHSHDEIKALRDKVQEQDRLIRALAARLAEHVPACDVRTCPNWGTTHTHRPAPLTIDRTQAYDESINAV